MNLTVKRDYFSTHTYGVWYKDDMPINLVSLELPWLDNQKKISCIPEGTYKCTLFQSPSKGLVYLLHDVPNRDMIEIHVANYTSDLLGCLGMGCAFAKMLNPKTKQMEAAVSNSSAALAKLMALTGSKEFTLTITR